MKRLLLLFLLLSPVPLYAADPMEIIELKSRSVEEVIPIIRPLLEPDGKVSGMNNQLIIRAKPEQISEVRKILQRIDRPARKLIIYVRHGATYDLDRDGVTDVALGTRGAVWLVCLNQSGGIKTADELTSVGLGLSNPDQCFGLSVSGGGRLNEDRVPDLLVGSICLGYGAGTETLGQAYLIALDDGRIPVWFRLGCGDRAWGELSSDAIVSGV